MVGVPARLPPCRRPCMLGVGAQASASMALRRLARHALHRAASDPAHLPPLIPFPPELRSHILLLRFSTTSSDPPHFMVDYLVSTCGVSPDMAAKAAPRIAHLRSPDRPDAVLAFLRSQGLTRAQVRAIVTSHPRLLLSNVDATIAPKFRAARSVGFTRAEVARFFALYPHAFTWGVHSNLLPQLLFWLDLLGSTRLLVKCHTRTWLFKYGMNGLKDNMSTLRGFGIPEAQLIATVRCKPALIMRSAAKLRALAARVDACGVPRGSWVYAWALLALCGVSDAAFRAKMAAVTRATGCTEQEFLAMFGRAPCFVSVSTELLRRKVEFLMDTVGCSADLIVRTPVLLMLSLSKRMEPRCRAIEALKARGVDVGKKLLVRIMITSEARFLERYILRYSHQAPELLELYPPDQHKGRLGVNSSTIGSSSQSEGD